MPLLMSALTENTTWVAETATVLLLKVVQFLLARSRSGIDTGNMAAWPLCEQRSSSHMFTSYLHGTHREFYVIFVSWLIRATKCDILLIKSRQLVNG
jgi:hypothetical protein